MNATATVTPPLTSLGVGIDTARYGHHISFVREDKQPAARPLEITESRDGYNQLQERLLELHKKHPNVTFHVHLDAAGQYASNLERFLRTVPVPMVFSIGEPKRNKDYHKAMSPKRTSDATESYAMARFGVVEKPSPTHPVPDEFYALCEIVGRLQGLVKDTTRAINRAHNVLARVFPELATIVDDLSAASILALLEKYPTPQRIAAARLESLQKIPYLRDDKAKNIHEAAKKSVGSLQGDVAESLIQQSVDQIQTCMRARKKLEELLLRAYEALPRTGHVQVPSILGIGDVTAAVLVAKIVSIDRFATPEDLVGYFGVFPEENTSGYNRRGEPVDKGSMQMSAKGSDVVRRYLWNAAKNAIETNPAVRSLYRRLRAKGTRGDVALGHCMRKLLHLVFAVWSTDTAFSKTHYAWEPVEVDPDSAANTAVPAEEVALTEEAAPTETAPEQSRMITRVITEPALPVPTEPAPEMVTVDGTTPAAATETAVLGAEETTTPDTVLENAYVKEVITDLASPVPKRDAKKVAAGHKREPSPQNKVVTATVSSLETPCAAVNKRSSQHGTIDFAFIREQVSMRQVLQHLGLLDRLRETRGELRGPCPIHGSQNPRSRSFAANLAKNVFSCHNTACAKAGNVIDFWAAIQKLPPYEAACHLADTFNVPTTRTEQKRRGARNMK